MSIDIVKAIKAPWQNGGGFWRMFLGALVFCIPILGFISQGYLMEYLKNVSEGKDELKNIFEHGSQSFVIGFKYIVGFILLLIPFAVLMFICALLMGKDNRLILELIYQVLNIIFMLVLFVMTVNFCTDHKIASFLDFKSGVSIIKESPVKFIIACLFSFVVQILYTLCLVVVGIVLAILVPLFIKIPLFGIILVLVMIFFAGAFMFASAVATTNIMGQYAAESAYITQRKQQNQN